MKVFLLNIFLILFFSFACYSQQKSNNPSGQPIRAYLNINYISTVLKNDGTSDIDVAESNSGFVYPKGSGKAAVYISGLLWGALVPGDLAPRVGGSAYSTGLQPGKDPFPRRR